MKHFTIILITLLSLTVIWGVSACNPDEEPGQELPVPDPNPDPAPDPVPDPPAGNRIQMTIGSARFTTTLQENAAASTFKTMLPITVSMTEMGGYEKYHYLPQSLTGNATNVGTTYEGDLMIWSSSCLVLFYTTRTTSYSYIRLGRIDNTSGLRQAVGTGNITVTFEMLNE
ncbi:MAG: hypothetical protein LBQ60_13845 [Bacteroidales bacterium]|jgi:hypothetical protein|nr:hypothetical protein [Bacteroidales bacterium]